jgi:hypothetical protein
MNGSADVQAGVCGFRTKAVAASDDGQMVTFAVESDCPRIGRLAEALRARGPIDAYQEIGPEGPGVVMSCVRENLTGCCAGCAVPVGIFKAMQVAAGLALPKDIEITLRRE